VRWWGDIYTGKFEIIAKNEIGGGSFARCTSSLDLLDLDDQNDNVLSDSWCVCGFSSWMQILLQDARCNRMNIFRLRKYWILFVLQASSLGATPIHMNGWSIHIPNPSWEPFVQRRCTTLSRLSMPSTPLLILSQTPPHTQRLRILGRYGTTHSYTFVSLTLIFLHALWFIYLRSLLLCWRGQKRCTEFPEVERFLRDAISSSA